MGLKWEKEKRRPERGNSDLNRFGRCSPVRLTRSFRNAANRCPILGSSQKERSDQPLSISPKSTDRRLVSSDQLRPPSPTNKAVNPIRRSSSGVQTHMNRNDREVLCQNTIASSTLIFSSPTTKFFHANRKSLSDSLVRAPPHPT